MDAVALINYPGHFLSTLGTIKNFHEITHWRSPWYIFVDDLGPQFKDWDGNYLDDLKSAVDANFPDLNPTYITFSDFNFPYVWDGWLRQQMVKLNLQQFLPGDIWYVTDGDVICERLIGANEIPYNYQTTHNPLINAQQKSYMQQMLGSRDSLTLDGEEIYTHHIPVRWVTRDDLDNLNRHVSDVNGNGMNMVHFNLMQSEQIIGYGPTPEHMSMTEWDLLEIWRILVDGQAPDYQYWLINDGVTRPQFNKTPTWVDTFFGTDRDFDIKHFTNQGLTVTVEQWEKCQTISRL
jgi:hypothetical protein